MCSTVPYVCLFVTNSKTTELILMLFSVRTAVKTFHQLIEKHTELWDEIILRLNAFACNCVLKLRIIQCSTCITQLIVILTSYFGT